MEELQAQGARLNWGEKEVARYDAVDHIMRFVNRTIYEILNRETVEGKVVIDIGGGTGVYAEHMLEHDPKVVMLVDISPAMLQKAQERLEQTGKTQFTVEQGDAAALRFENNTFDIVTSVTVACNLDAIKFKQHFEEAYRVTTPEGMCVMVTPSSIDRHFTDGQDTRTPAEIQRTIDDQWAATSAHTDQAAKNSVLSLEHMLSGSFIKDADGKPLLIHPGNRDQVRNGDPILRKLPHLVVNNVYHDVEEYKRVAQESGWTIEQTIAENFANEEDRAEYNAHADINHQLGSEYIGNPPFTISVLRKAA